MGLTGVPGAVGPPGPEGTKGEPGDAGEPVNMILFYSQHKTCNNAINYVRALEVFADLWALQAGTAGEVELVEMDNAAWPVQWVRKERRVRSA